MAIRAIQARIECDKTLLDHLWRTHKVFNERLPGVLSLLFNMRKGKVKATPEQRERIASFANALLQLNARQIYDTFIKAASGSARNATAKKNLCQISADAASALDDFAKGWTPLRQSKESLADLPNHVERKVIEDACAYIRGHLALTKQWNEEHAEWLKKKEEWESEEEHKKYLALRTRFDEFEKSVGGKAGKRRARWHKYLQWLRENPDLAGWRGGPKVVNDLPKKAQERVRKAKPWKQRGVEAEEFFNANLELQALDKLHGVYEKEFIRRRKRKRNPDGFDHRPTFTLPHFLRHPRWFVFNAPQTSPPGYRKLILPTKPGEYGTIELRLLTGEIQGAKYPEGWVKVRFRGDPRLSDFKPVKVPKPATKGKIKGELRDRLEYRFYDKELQRERPAQISGAKLIFRNIRLNGTGSLESATPYLYFTCEAESLRWTENARKVTWSETGEVTKKGKKRGYRTLPDGLVACAVDLGVRNLGFATLARYENGVPRILRSRNLWIGHTELKGRHQGRWSPGPELAHLAAHKRELRDLRSLRGDPVAGEESHVELQEHITYMGEDRFKKAARAIVSFALNVEEAADKRTGEIYPQADVLVLENLATLIPDAEKERGINRALIEFNRGHLVDRLKELCGDEKKKSRGDVGLRLIFVSPVGTSQVCSKCNALGRRYSICRNPETHKPDIQFGFVEKLFACPQCGFRANADHNASVNLHRRFAQVPGAFAQWDELRSKYKDQQRASHEEIEAKLLPSLRKMHRLDVAGEPF